MMKGQISLPELFNLFLSDIEKSMDFEKSAEIIAEQTKDTGITDADKLRVMFYVIHEELSSNIDSWMTIRLPHHLLNHRKQRKH